MNGTKKGAALLLSLLALGVVSGVLSVNEARGDTLSTAITFGKSVSASIQPAGDIDTYTFSAEAADVIFIRMSQASEPLNPQVRLYDSEETELAGNWGLDTAEIQFSLNKAGNYKVLAGDYYGKNTGDYGIFVQRLNKAGSATPIRFGETVAASISSVGDIKTHSFTANAGDEILVSIDRTSGSLFPEVRLYGADGARLARNWGNKTAEISYTLVKTGEHTVLAGDYRGYQTGDYSLSLKLLTPAPPAPQPTSKPPSTPTTVPIPIPSITITPAPTLTLPPTQAPTPSTVTTPAPAPIASRPNVYSTYIMISPIIDGVLSQGEWQGNPLGKTLSYVAKGITETHEMTSYFMHDNDYLYVAIIITNNDFESVTDVNPDVDVLELYFDNDNDGVIEQDEDIRNFWNLKCQDWRYSGNGAWSKDQREDGTGAVTHSNQGVGNYVYEFKIPLDSGDAQDLSLTPNSTVGIKILYREMYYDTTVAKYIWGEAEDGWPTKVGRFDGATYGQLVLSAGKAAPQPTGEKDFGNSIPLPKQVSTDPAVIGTNILWAIITVLLFYFGATVFNSTVKENYPTIQGWLQRVPNFLRFLNPSSLDRGLIGNKITSKGYTQGILIVAVCALIYWFLNPYFTNGLKGISLYISLALGIAIVTLSYDGTQLLVSRRAGVQGVIRVFPIAILIAIVCVALSRAIQFRPGLIFGFVGAYTAVTSSQMVLKSEEEKDVKQRAVAILLGIGVVLIISLTAFFLRGLLYETAWREGDAWRYLVEDILVAAFAIGLEGLVFSLVPMDFLDGKRVFTWNRRVWLIAVLLTTFIFYHIIINPDDKLADAVKDAKKYVMIALVILFLIISLGMWLYFKGRRKALPKDKVPTPALSDTDEVPRAADTATQVPPENVAMQENTEILTSQRVEMVDKMAGAVEPGPISPESARKQERLAEKPPSSPGSDLPNGQEKPQAS